MGVMVMDMDMVDMVIMDIMARGLLMLRPLLLLSQDMVMDMDMAMVMVMDMDIMARGLLMPDMAMDMVMGMAMDMDMVMVMDMVMDTMVKQQLFECSKISVKEVDWSESSQKRHKIKICYSFKIKLEKKNNIFYSSK